MDAFYFLLRLCLVFALSFGGGEVFPEKSKIEWSSFLGGFLGSGGSLDVGVGRRL
jgi:hypothetical protein